jgi:hypothetical protein
MKFPVGRGFCQNQPVCAAAAIGQAETAKIAEALKRKDFIV